MNNSNYRVNGKTYLDFAEVTNFSKCSQLNISSFDQYKYMASVD